MLCWIEAYNARKGAIEAKAISKFSKVYKSYRRIRDNDNVIGR